MSTTSVTTTHTSGCEECQWLDAPADEDLFSWLDTTEGPSVAELDAIVAEEERERQAHVRCEAIGVCTCRTLHHVDRPVHWQV